jgi:hypothetical protein
MTYHKNLSKGLWKKLTFCQKMANIGSEVERTIIWRGKKKEYSQMAFARALDLMDLTISEEADFYRLKELLRTREALADYFFGENLFKTSDSVWRKYFFAFNFSAQIKK